MIDELSIAPKRFRMMTPCGSSSSPSTSAVPLPPHVVRAQQGLQSLREMLPWVRALLKDAEEREILEASVQIWLRELRDVAYDADDALDEFEYHLLQADAGATTAEADAAPPRRTPISAPPHANNRGDALPKIDALFWGKLDLKVEKIKKRFETIYKRPKALRSTEEVIGQRRRRDATAGASARTPSSCFIATPCFYGREEEKKKVIDGSLLSNKSLDRRLSVIPIFGMGGVGKTTLVQHIYNDLAVSANFQMKGWVCVSDNVKVVPLTKRILEALTKNSHDLNEFSTLQEALARAVEGKRFLLVLDDMWDDRQEPWEQLQAPMFSCKQGSAIVITTRSERVALRRGTVTPLQLRCLSDQECWKIFQEHAFGGRDPGRHPGLVEIGRRIVTKCKGLPLAAKALGSLLRSKPDVESWEDILHSDLWDPDGRGDGVLSALRLSYLHLESNLKQCFAYCSVFPQAHRFTKSQLVYMWVAQGFIDQHGSSRHAEDVGSEYFEELLQRSFFQFCPGEQLFPYPKEREEMHVVMHDLMHDLAQSVSRGGCLRIEHAEARSDPNTGGGRRFVHELLTPRGESFRSKHGRTPSLSIGGAHHSRTEHGESQGHPITGARHLSMVGAVTSCNREAAWTLRTLMILKVLFVSPKQSRVLNSILPGLHCLRVLNLGHLPVCELPDAFGNLVHLRYLNLSHTLIEKLPDSICKLYHMQTLLLTGCERLRGLPKGTNQLINLRNLPVFYAGRHGEGCGAGVQELKGLVNLRGSLTIRRLGLVLHANDAKMAGLRNKAGLRELRLSWADASAAAPISDPTEVLEGLEPPTSLRVLEVFEYGGGRFPGWMGSPTVNKLVKLELHRFSNCVVLPELGRLPCLQRLHIRYALSVECMGSEFRGDARVGFPSLEVLLLEHLCELERWHAVDRGDFPRLRELEIRHCSKLKGALPILYPLPMLEKLVLHHCDVLDSLLLYNLPSLRSPDVAHCPQLKFIKTQEPFHSGAAQECATRMNAQVPLRPGLG